MPAPKSIKPVKEVPVQFYVARLFARHIVPGFKGGKGYYSGVEIRVNADNKIDLSYGASEAALAVRMFLADQEFVTAKKTIGSGKKAKTAEVLAKLNGQVTLKVDDASHFGLVSKQLQKGKVVESSPAASITIDIKNGSSPLSGDPGSGVVVLRGIKVGTPPKDPIKATITIEMGDMKDEKKNAVAKEQLAIEHIAKDEAVTWPAELANRVHPEEIVRRYPGSNKVSDLEAHFAENVQSFFDALEGITPTVVSSVHPNATFRSPQEAYLYWWTHSVARNNFNPSRIRDFLNLDGSEDKSFPKASEIEWRCAKDFIGIHGLAPTVGEYNPPNTMGRHLQRMAVDCNVFIDIFKKLECTMDIPASFWKLSLSGSPSNPTITAVKQDNRNRDGSPKRTETFALEPGESPDGWVDIGPKESDPVLIKGKGTDKETWRVGSGDGSRAAAPTFVIDVSGVKLEDGRGEEIGKEVKERLTASHEEAFQKKVDAETDKRVAAEGKKKKTAVSDERKQQIHDDVVKAFRPAMETELKKAIDSETKAQIQRELKAKKQEEHDRQFDEKSLPAMQQAIQIATDRRMREGNFWRQFHRIGEQFFGVIHFGMGKPDPNPNKVVADLVHWSIDGH